MLSRKSLISIVILVSFVPAVFVCWQIVKMGMSVWELVLTVFGGVAFFVSVSFIAAAIIAYLTRSWTEWWKDWILAVGGFYLFYVGIYGAFYTTYFVLVGKIVGAVGIVLTAATLILTPFRRVFRKQESDVE